MRAGESRNLSSSFLLLKFNEKTFLFVSVKQTLEIHSREKKENLNSRELI